MTLVHTAPIPWTKRVHRMWACDFGYCPRVSSTVVIKVPEARRIRSNSLRLSHQAASRETIRTTTARLNVARKAGERSRHQRAICGNGGGVFMGS